MNYALLICGFILGPYQDKKESAATNSKSDAVVWREWVSRDANPVMPFPIEKRINTELYIDKMAALYIVDGQIKNVVRMVNQWY